MLDVFHALEHIADVSKTLHPDTTAATAWLDAARDVLLHRGWEGIDAFVQREAAARTQPQQAAVEALRNDLVPH